MDCQKKNNKPCSNSSKPCMLTKTSKCCWHEDTRHRNEMNKIYIDEYGYIDVTYYGFTVPVDMYYCPNCKITTETADNIIEQLKQVMEDPEAYKRRIYLAEKAREREAAKANTRRPPKILGGKWW